MYHEIEYEQLDPAEEWGLFYPQTWPHSHACNGIALCTCGHTLELFHGCLPRPRPHLRDYRFLDLSSVPRVFTRSFAFFSKLSLALLSSSPVRAQAGMAETSPRRMRTVDLRTPKKWTDREPSPDPIKMWRRGSAKDEPDSTTPDAEEGGGGGRGSPRAPVLYYLSVNGQLQHPHFIEVSLSSSQGLYLRGTCPLACPFLFLQPYFPAFGCFNFHQSLLTLLLRFHQSARPAPWQGHRFHLLLVFQKVLPVACCESN